MKTETISRNSLIGRNLCALVVCLGSVITSITARAVDPPADSAPLATPTYSFHTSRTETMASGIRRLVGANYVYTSIPEKIDVDLRLVPTAAPWRAGDPSWEVPRRRGPPAIVDPKPVNQVASVIDPLLQGQASRQLRASASLSSPLFNFDGIRTGTSPNDPNGEAGKDWFVVAINASGVSGTQYMFYDKADPTIKNGPYTLSNLGSGVCAGGGDPVVLYDELAERWIFTEFSSGSTNRLCVYISQSDDPISGGFYVYTFQAPGFPDYPKYAVWGDAYYVGTNESKSALYALDRSAMLDGLAASMQRFTVADPAAFGFAMIPPVDLDGTVAAPAGSPGIFIRHYDDEAHSPNSNVPTEDYLELFELDVDFTTPANSSVNQTPIRIAVSEFSSELCGYVSFNCFPQKDSSSKLDPLREVVMNLPKYRNFGDHETIVGNFTVDVDGTDHGGIRWFELRRSGGNWSLYQEGTWSPDGDNRFMGASAMDSNGNIALGYSISSSSLYPGVRYTGRLASSPLGSMSEAELTLVDGTGPAPNVRWGDYGSLSVDPQDGCTFWLVENYAIAGSSARQNRVGSFKFDSCGQPLDIQFEDGFESP